MAWRPEPLQVRKRRCVFTLAFSQTSMHLGNKYMWTLMKMIKTINNKKIPCEILRAPEWRKKFEPPSVETKIACDYLLCRFSLWPNKFWANLRNFHTNIVRLWGGGGQWVIWLKQKLLLFIFALAASILNEFQKFP